METDRLFENNRKWVSEKLGLDANYFKNLAKGQAPQYLYIGCSDSRVSAEAMMGAEPGELFVHRNIANIVPNTDLSAMSVINYAVVHLKVNHIIVCGHYNCGGVHAAMKTSYLGVLNPWLRNIRDVYRMHKPELEKIEDEENKFKHLVRLNVREQCINVLKTTEVRTAIMERGLRVHAWVFDIHTGKLIDLKLDFQSVIRNLKDLY
ncbi:MAG: carbonic anhydrase [Chlorobi bacterium]|nr:carbonic anhydrase [Chlorobiota bacterium]